MCNRKAIKIAILLFLTLLPFLLVTAAEADDTVGKLSNIKADAVFEESAKIQKIELSEILDNEKAKLKASQRKLSTDLLKLVNVDFILPGQNKEELKKQMQSLKQLRLSATVNRSVYGAIDNELVYVYIYLKSPAGTNVIDSYAHEVTNRDEENHVAVAWVEINRLDTMANLDSVRFIQTVLPPMCNTGSMTSEGDGIHRADLVRSLGQDGAGIKIGIISDGVDHWTNARNSGDIPANLHILSNTVGGDEGTAMLEIVHDLAPGADLYFHDCGANSLAFNDAIDELIAAGCNVICDDISWLDQPFFEDGPVAKHVAAVLAQNNVTYVSSAGNYAYNHYQGTYRNGGNNFHDFSNGTSDYEDLYIKVPFGNNVLILLQWNDEFGASNNDYDLWLYDEATEEIVAISEYIQNGNGDPIEAIIYTNDTSQDVMGHILVYKTRKAATKTLEVFIYQDYNSILYIDNLTPEDSIYGHAAVTNAITVGAINVSNQNQIAYYSSQGPVTINYPSSKKRAKPDICGMDEVTVTGVGGFGSPFLGTSAAAPHVAAIAALLWAENPNEDATEIRNVLLSQASDLGDTGFDNIYGYGRADALSAYHYITPPVYQSAASSNRNRTATLTFTENLVANVANLKGAVTFSADGTNFGSLGTGDTVSINGSTLVVTFNTALAGSNNKIRVAAATLKDTTGNILTAEITTDAIAGFNCDINGDGTINLLDLLWISSKIGPATTGEATKADVNNDGEVNILDLMAVAGDITNLESALK
ncbi:MAG: S8 family serine peptidase [Desulfotomaculaceae bacterium]|nr:S8 family serine peptidase [Desulfotomaculaceae bacterium]